MLGQRRLDRVPGRGGGAGARWPAPVKSARSGRHLAIADALRPFLALVLVWMVGVRARDIHRQPEQVPEQLLRPPLLIRRHVTLTTERPGSDHTLAASVPVALLSGGTPATRPSTLERAPPLAVLLGPEAVRDRRRRHFVDPRDRLEVSPEADHVAPEMLILCSQSDGHV